MKTNLKLNANANDDVVVYTTDINGKPVRAVLTSDGRVMVAVSDVAFLIVEGGGASGLRKRFVDGAPIESRLYCMLYEKALQRNVCIEATALYDSILSYRNATRAKGGLKASTKRAIDDMMPKFKTAFIDSKVAEPTHEPVVEPTPEPVVEPTPEPAPEPVRVDPLDSLAMAIARPLSRAIKSLVANQRATFEAQDARIAELERVLAEVREALKASTNGGAPTAERSMQKLCEEAAHRYAGLGRIHFSEAWSIIYKHFYIAHGKDLIRLARGRGPKMSGLAMAAELGMLDELLEVIVALTNVIK